METVEIASNLASTKDVDKTKVHCLRLHCESCRAVLHLGGPRQKTWHKCLAMSALDSRSDLPVLFVGAFKEIIEPYVVQGSCGGKRRNVAPYSAIPLIRAHHHSQAFQRTMPLICRP